MRKTWLKKTLICMLATVLTTSVWSSSLPMRAIASETKEEQIETKNTDEQEKEEIKTEEVVASKEETEDTVIEETVTDKDTIEEPVDETQEPTEDKVVEEIVEPIKVKEIKPTLEVIAEEKTVKQEKAMVTITSEDQLTPYFPDQNFRKAVFHAVSDGQDNAKGTDIVDALANFAGNVNAKGKGIVDAHGIELLRKANKVDLTNNLIIDFSFLGVNNNHNTYEEWYGVDESEAEDREQGRNVYWILDKNPLEFLPSDFGGRLVIHQAAVTAFHYADDIGTLYKHVRNNTESGTVSGIINTNKTKMVFPDGNKTDAKIISVDDPKINGYDRIAIAYNENTDKGYAKFSDLARSSSIVKIAVGLDQVITYWTTDEWGTNTPGSQSFKYYMTERIQIYDKITVSDVFDGAVKLTKVDKDNNKVTLSGAEFELYKTDGTRFDNNTYTSDASGIIEVKGLATGDYYFKETKAPTGYLLSNETFKFSITNPKDKATTLSGGLKEITPTDATTPTIAADNERFMVGPNKIDEASPDIALTKASNTEVTKVYLNYTYDDETKGKTVMINEVYDSLEKAASRINEIKNKNQLLGEVKVSVNHKSISDSNITEVEATNEKIPLKSIKVVKHWMDHATWQGEHPDITIRLYANRKEIAVTTLKHGELEYTFDNLPATDQNGVPINYTVREDTIHSENNVEGYLPTIVASDEGFTITNQWTITDKISIAGIKEWDDFNNKLSYRPESIHIVLYRDSIEYAHAEVSEKSDWKFRFDNIPLEDANDKAYIYTLEEHSESDKYKKLEPISITKENGFNHGDTFKVTLENKLTEESNKIASISGTKTWIDYNNAYNLRPASIEVELLQNGKATGIIQKVTSDNQGNWSYSFDKLDKLDSNGNEYTYSIRENNIDVNYTASVDGNNLTNSLSEDMNKNISISGTKTWIDYNNAFNLRPESIDVELLQNDVVITTKKVTVNKQNEWTYSFDKLAKFDKDGNEYVYTINEKNIADNYTASIDGNNLINTLDPTINVTSIDVEKKWIDFDNALETRPDSIEVNLLQDGKVLKTETLSKDSKAPWKAIFTELPKYTDDGKAYVYTIEEVEIPNKYSVNVEKLENAFILTNTLSDEANIIVSISGTKTWIDYNNAYNLRPTSIEVVLLQNGEATGNTQTVTPDKQGNWTYSFDKLDRLDSNGKAYTYSVQENNVDENYTASVEGNNLTNTLNPILNETSINVEKKWVDFNNALETRPDSIEVKLLQDGTEFKTATLSKDSDTPWKAVFNELPKYTDDGKAYVYTVEEVEIPNKYSVNIEQQKDILILTNTLDRTLNDNISIHVKKAWDDKGNEQNRPENLAISIKQDGIIIQTFNLNESNKWEMTIKGLAKYNEDGKAYEYSVEEADIKNYKQSDKSSKQGENGQWVYLFTNTYISPEEPGEPGTPPTEPEDPKTPNTGDTTQPILLLGLLIMSSSVMTIVLSKKNKKPYKIKY